MKGKKRTLVVDDSAYSRQTIKDMLSKEPDIEVVGVAVNGVDAIDKTLRYKPDIIVLDIEMPVMDGFAFLRWLMMERPTPVIIVSSITDNKTLFKALNMGAIDFVSKPTKRASTKLRKIEDELIMKIRNIDSKSLQKLKDTIYLSDEAGVDYRGIKQISPSVIAIGASTGGPQAIEYILRNIGKIPVSILISQHMPAGYTKTFAERLNSVAPLKVKEAEDNEIIRPYTTYICPGGHHMEVINRGGSFRIALIKPSKNDKYVPSVDRLMSSVAKHFKNRSIGVILTGMGVDGREGIMKIFSQGGYTIAESDETAVVFGMPKEAINAGTIKKVLPLQKIPEELLKVLQGS
jgi:two-component system chemotaxis response regulator CheB